MLNLKAVKKHGGSHLARGDEADQPAASSRFLLLLIALHHCNLKVDILLIRAVSGMVAAAWRAAARATDWPRLSAERTRLPDANFMALLADTPLAAAARRCYSAQPTDRALCPDGMCAPCCSIEACPESLCFWHAPFACQGMVLLAGATRAARRCYSLPIAQSAGSAPTACVAPCNRLLQKARSLTHAPSACHGTVRCWPSRRWPPPCGAAMVRKLPTIRFAPTTCAVPLHGIVSLLHGGLRCQKRRRRLHALSEHHVRPCLRTATMSARHCIISNNVVYGQSVIGALRCVPQHAVLAAGRAAGRSPAAGC